MRIADYIENNAETILEEAHDFAVTLLPKQVHLDSEALRDHLPQILEIIVADLRTHQTEEEELLKSHGGSDTITQARSPAQWHGHLRAQAGFSIQHLVAEFRALRASVLRLWSAKQTSSEVAFNDMIRFNEAIDQAVAESVSHYAAEQETWRQVFLGVLGHDLRGPLNAILLTTEMMSTMALDAPLSKQASRLMKSGKRMNALLNDLLDYSRTSLGMGIRIERKQVDLLAEIADEVDLLRASWPNVPITLKAGCPTEVSVDASRVREALANLVNNAVKYGDADAGVEIYLDVDETHVKVRVDNKGTSIPASTVETMFEPLQRGRARSNSDDSVSLGLGLFVVREVAKAHGGDVEVTSTDTRTTFVLNLLREAEAPPEGEPDSGA